MVTRKIVCEQRAWSISDSISFFSNNRHSADKLYPSERIFLPTVVNKVNTVLDVGCACGGFSSIMRSFNESIQYFGIDIVSEMIEQARNLYPREQFAVAAGHALPFPPQVFDLVHCSGAIHLNSAYEIMIAEMWRVSRDYLLFDLRLTEGASFSGEFKVSQESNGCEEKMLPYHVVNIEETRGFIEALPEPPERVELCAYYHPPSANSSFDPDTQILMGFLLMHRHAETTGWDISIDHSN